MCIAVLRGKVGLIIVLSHLGLTEDKKLASPPVSRQVCITCHGPFNCPNFDYERYLPKVRH